MPQATTYDAIVIGAARGGKFLPGALAEAGKKVALIERDHLGGTCVNRGCTPTKTMIASARAAYLARRVAEYGIHSGPVSVDMQAVHQRKQCVVEADRGNIASFFKATQESTHRLDLLRGEAHFIAAKTLEVRCKSGEVQQITAPLIFIDVGNRPKQLTIKGVEGVSVLNSTSILDLETLPEHLFIIGGGYIGLEFGQMFRRFGSEVTLIHRQPRLLMREDEDVCEVIAEIFRGEGITVLTNTTPQRVEQRDGCIRLTVSTPQGERQLSGSHLLSAVGRIPNTEALTLEAAGIQLDKDGYIQVNEHLETNVPGIYAMGDAKGGPAFTHVTQNDFTILRTNLLEHGNASTRGRVVPYTIFIDPELGRVGLTEHEARTQGRNIRVAKVAMKTVARAIESGETRGFMKAIVDADTQQILGCAILSAEGGEIMTIVQIAMMGELPYTALRDGMINHPTLAEGLNNLFRALDA
jgi:pyruvate/2-oxoglutarate dehydrogenase complex dihydrolipoamide dehydrogenase (E3) component